MFDAVFLALVIVAGLIVNIAILMPEFSRGKPDIGIIRGYRKIDELIFNVACHQLLVTAQNFQ
ncbi:hypothetical protein C6H64_12285 [Photorhabdus luminescens]|nr:hypothetical protein C6H64_12285 [Photorhabdus luminescens]PQQ35332.1 hypothetical protein C6H69_00095 [Photorhabdus luminescens]